MKISVIRHLNSQAQLKSARRRWQVFRNRLEKHGLKRGKSGLAPRTNYFETTVGILSLGIRAVGLWGVGVRNALRIRLVRHEIPIPGLPAQFDGYRILHLSDFHIDLMPPLVEATIAVLEGVETDLAILTGDYQAHYGPDHAHLEQPFSRIFGAIRSQDGIVGILGNHDCASMADMLSSIGATMLVNETVALRRDGEEICITGTDDVHHYWSPAARRALESAPPDRVRIALVHTSELAADAAALGYSLYLTGHTHGGQVCLPGGLPLITMGMRREYAAGLWRIGDMIGHTSRGIGASCVPLRYNCPPEIALITLKSA